MSKITPDRCYHHNWYETADDRAGTGNWDACCRPDGGTAHSRNCPGCRHHAIATRSKHAGSGQWNRACRSACARSARWHCKRCQRILPPVSPSGSHCAVGSCGCSVFTSGPRLFSQPVAHAGKLGAWARPQYVPDYRGSGAAVSLSRRHFILASAAERTAEVALDAGRIRFAHQVPDTQR
jgi:hypothetical protein